ncbi:MAG: oligosaccharyl transferase, archaeosortase A system-associated, partial [Methanoregula sp.]|nr:oligosaccharyl transferase, archaeosortase A system-associated [Methanoregula sp.]
TPSTVYYIEYLDSSVTKIAYPIINFAEKTNTTAARLRAEQFNLKASPGSHAVVMNPEFPSPDFVHPIDTVPAMQHYRLVHESPTEVIDSTVADIRYVKVFEYVKGAHIKGDGIIEVPIVTDTGRNFTYRQASVNGEFIVPYSTAGNPYGVKTTGKYIVSGSEKQYEVSESAVLEGSTIQ